MTKQNGDKSAAPPGSHKKSFIQAAREHARRSDDGNAFFPDPGGGPSRVKDDLAEEVAEEFIASATSGEGVGEENLNAYVPEDDGGPFIETSGKQEFASGTDASNPEGADREAFPTANGKPA